MNKYSFIFAPVKIKDENKITDVYSATLKLVKENGVAGITMQSVAKEAGIATGTLYIYFENKEELITKLFDVSVRNTAAGIFRNYDAKDPFKVGFRKIWENMLRYRLSNFNESIFIEQCFHSPFVDEDTRVSIKKMFDPMINLLQRGKEEHLIKEIDTFWLVAFMTGTIHEVAKRMIYFSKKPTNDILDANFQLCWDGIKS